MYNYEDGVIFTERRFRPCIQVRRSIPETTYPVPGCLVKHGNCLVDPGSLWIHVSTLGNHAGVLNPANLSCLIKTLTRSVFTFISLPPLCVTHSPLTTMKPPLHFKMHKSTIAVEASDNRRCLNWIFVLIWERKNVFKSCFHYPRASLQVWESVKHGNISLVISVLCSKISHILDFKTEKRVRHTTYTGTMGNKLWMNELSKWGRTVQEWIRRYMNSKRCILIFDIFGPILFNDGHVLYVY